MSCIPPASRVVLLCGCFDRLFKVCIPTERGGLIPADPFIVGLLCFILTPLGCKKWIEYKWCIYIHIYNYLIIYIYSIIRQRVHATVVMETS